MVVAAFLVCAVIMTHWLASPPRPGADTDAASAQVPTEETLRLLSDARLNFREHLLEVNAHLRLSEALWKAGRPIDAFYVSYAARQLFSNDVFRRAHSEIVLGAGGPAAELRRRLSSVSAPAAAIGLHIDIARRHPDTPEGRDSLDALMRMAAADENTGGGETARLARTALEGLHHSDPRHPGKLTALGMAMFMRGDFTLAHAIASEALQKNPNQGGAAQVMGALALQQRDLDGALRWLTIAWDRNSDDLYSASKLAQIYDNLRADSEGALPFHLALYRNNPDYADGGTPIENRIRQTLDERRAYLLKNVTVDALGSRFVLDDASLRAEACLRAGYFKDPRWIDALVDLLDDDVEIVRRNADYALFEIGKNNTAAIQARRERWLGDDKPLVRIRALNLFADLEGRNAVPSLVAALRDPDPAVRAFAKIMVLDHYFKQIPEYPRIKARYLAEEKNPQAVALLTRFSSGQ